MIQYNNELSKEIIQERIKLRKWTINKDQFIKELIDTFSLTNILYGNITNLSTHDFINPLLYSHNNDFINPLLWEYGHILFFWEHLIFKNLNNNINNNIITNSDYYDSFKISRVNRYKLLECNKLLSYNIIKEQMDKKLEFIIENIKNEKFDSFYLIRLGQLHQEMHIESILYSIQLLYFSMKPEIIVGVENNDIILKDIEMIEIEQGILNQGVDNSTTQFYFDNEHPQFQVNIEKFKVSKYCITNGMYLEFVLNQGYNTKDYWLEEGWNWLKNNQYMYPIYWKYENNYWYILDNLNLGINSIKCNKFIPLQMNHPVVNISWYEAMAFCKWKGVRLLKESEWEYIAKDYDNNTTLENANLDYNIKCCISVLEDKNVNRNGIVGLFGNCWEWCLEPIYPYDGFIIDPVYREMSYPYFGSKRICRGGAWSTPSILITPTYRNAQAPDCNIQYIGFRVAMSWVM